MIETLAALTVFALITVGITPLIISSMRGSTLARSYTVGKNLGQEAMERVRGFPYFDAAPARDVLDLYYPNLAAGYNAATQTFTTVCTATTATPAASGARACPPDHPGTTTPRIPGGYTVAFTARFVTPSTTTPVTLITQPPPAGYDSTVSATATPPTLTEIVITVSWTSLGSPRSFTLSSVLGQRKLSINRLSGRASINFVVQALTSFEDSSGRLSSIKATAGTSTSDIEVRGFAAADQDTRAGELVLTQNEFGSSPGSTLAELTGAVSTLHAPPNTAPAPYATKAPQTVTHGGGFSELQVAHLGASAVDETTTSPSTITTGELPRTLGNFALIGGAGVKSFWIRNQSNGSLLGLTGGSSSQPFYIQRDSGPVRLSGSTYAEATPPTPPATRKVHTTVSAVSSPMYLFPTSFAPNGVVQIVDFVMNLECRSTGVLATSVVSGVWSARLRWWQDGVYSPYITLGGRHDNAAGTPDPLAGLSVANNQVVNDPFLFGETTWLFDEPNRVPTPRIGYLRSWQTTTVVPTTKTAIRTEAELPFAIDIRTAPTDASIPETAISITAGKASCFAEDAR